MAKPRPGLREEALLWEQGSAFVFGVDEAGRGSLAGPVCAAVTCWPASAAEKRPKVKVTDSKLMEEEEREAAFGPITKLSLAHGVGFATSAEIDRWNILHATYLAAARAVEQALASLVNQGLIAPGSIDAGRFAFLADGDKPLFSRSRPYVHSIDYAPEFPLVRELFRGQFTEKCVVKGDSKIFSIASASVLAKVSRDRHMVELHKTYPIYEFHEHKGYSTPRHLQKLNEAGPCSEHRRSFHPVLESFRSRGEA